MIFEKYVSSNSNVERHIVVRNRHFVSQIDNLAEPAMAPDEAWWLSFLRGARAVNQRSHHTESLKIIDAFSGCGGLTLGVSQAALALGWSPEPLAAIDTDIEALNTYSANFPTAKTVAANVSSLVDYHVSSRAAGARFAFAPEIVHETLSDFVDKTDVYVAGPPCQGHSNLNNRTRREDPRNLLYSSAVALGVALHAKVIVIENVPEVERDSTSVVATAKALLRSSGYRFVDWDVLAADLLGAAQIRRRFFLVAVSPKTRFAPLRLERVRNGLRRTARPLNWAIGDLLDAVPSSVMDQAPVLSDDNVRRIDYLFDNDLYDLPDAVRPECHQNGTTYKSVYGRLHWDRPSQTVTTGFLTPGRGRYIHPLRRRVLTPHEAARIQFFPDSFRFVRPDANVPSRALLSKWIGDAVPPLLGYAAALGALSALSS